MRPAILSAEEESSSQPTFGDLYPLGLGAGIVGNVSGWLLFGCLFTTLSWYGPLSRSFAEGYGLLGVTLCFPVGPLSALAAGALGAWLGRVDSRRRPRRARRSSALLAFAFGAMTWLVIATLTTLAVNGTS